MDGLSVCVLAVGRWARCGLLQGGMMGMSGGKQGRRGHHVSSGSFACVLGLPRAASTIFPLTAASAWRGGARLWDTKSRGRPTHLSSEGRVFPRSHPLRHHDTSCQSRCLIGKKVESGFQTAISAVKKPYWALSAWKFRRGREVAGFGRRGAVMCFVTRTTCAMSVRVGGGGGRCVQWRVMRVV